MSGFFLKIWVEGLGGLGFRVLFYKKFHRGPSRDVFRVYEKTTCSGVPFSKTCSYRVSCKR